MLGFERGEGEDVWESEGVFCFRDLLGGRLGEREFFNLFFFFLK
jgi:hypothetical protein